MAINMLPPKIYNRIAAGEVVERPASVVKELVENSLDAGARKIKVEIVEGGIKKIVVADDGCGIEKEDLPLAFMPHATSKITEIEDLDGIETLGFRGEALASIASVSMITLSTKTKNGETGWQIKANGGEISKLEEVARVNGTTLTVQNLFYNTPARAKFLKKPKSEETEVLHLIEKFMMSHPEIDFEFIVDDKCVYNHKGGMLDEVIYLIYGKEVFDNLLKIDHFDNGLRVSGFVASPKLSRPNRTYQTLFVNGRYVENFMISTCVQGAFEPFLMKGRFPIFVLNIQIEYGCVDVNVHPNKKEVKFENSNLVFGVVRRAVERALIGTNLIAEFSSEEEKEFDKFSLNKKPSSPQNSAFEFESLSKNNAKKEEESKCEPKAEEIVSQKKAFEISNMPEFSKISSGSKAFDGAHNMTFRQSSTFSLKEVEIPVEKKIEEKKPISSEIVEEKFLNSTVDQVKIVGVVFKTYIITELEDSLYIVDQHAMHERQLYDNLKRQVDENNVARQDMLVPYAFDLGVLDARIFENALETLRNLGFVVAQSGGHFEILSVPYVLSAIKLDKFVEEVLADENFQTKTASGIINEKLCQTACKHAIRAGDDVTKEEIAYLIEQMKGGVMLCPHGRPIVVKMPKKELEKMFKRVL